MGTGLSEKLKEANVMGVQAERESGPSRGQTMDLSPQSDGKLMKGSLKFEV